jgi:hypothetical protein
MMQMRVFEFPGTIAVLGIDRDQAAALLARRGGLSTCLPASGDRREREAHIESYAEERRRQNAKNACRRASGRPGNESDRLDQQSEGGTS